MCVFTQNLGNLFKIKKYVKTYIPHCLLPKTTERQFYLSIYTCNSKTKEKLDTYIWTGNEIFRDINKNGHWSWSQDIQVGILQHVPHLQVKTLVETQISLYTSEMLSSLWVFNIALHWASSSMCLASMLYKNQYFK